MKALVGCILGCLGAWLNAQTQNSFEGGLGLLRVNALPRQIYYPMERPSMEFLNTLFFRATTNAGNFRAMAGYVKYAYTFEPPPGSADFFSGDIESQDFRLGLGLQWPLKRFTKRLYFLTDGYYRKTLSSGHRYGGIMGVQEHNTSVSNGADLLLGLGIKLKLFKSVYLSPELGYLCSNQFTKTLTRDLKTEKTYLRHSYDLNLHPLLNIYLSVGF